VTTAHEQSALREAWANTSRRCIPVTLVGLNGVRRRTCLLNRHLALVPLSYLAINSAFMPPATRVILLPWVTTMRMGSILPDAPVIAV